MVKLSKIFDYFTEEQFILWGLTNSTKKVKYIENQTFHYMTFIPE